MGIAPMDDPEEREHAKHLEQGRSGAHFCPDWDYMAIHDGMPEIECCLCELQHLRPPMANPLPPGIAAEARAMGLQIEPVPGLGKTCKETNMTAKMTDMPNGSVRWAPEAPMAIDVPPYDRCEHLDRAREMPRMSRPGTARMVGVAYVFAVLVGLILGVGFGVTL